MEKPFFPLPPLTELKQGNTYPLGILLWVNYIIFSESYATWFNVFSTTYKRQNGFLPRNCQLRLFKKYITQKASSITNSTWTLEMEESKGNDISSLESSSLPAGCMTVVAWLRKTEHGNLVGCVYKQAAVQLAQRLLRLEWDAGMTQVARRSVILDS